MANNFLKIPLAKVERTKAQIKCLNTDIRAFLDKSSYEIVSKLDTNRDEQIWSFRLKETIPAEISIVIGEILHNLRSSLDQMACAIALKLSGSSKDTYFPFGADADIFKKQLATKGKKLGRDACNMIQVLKPYKGGNDLLWYIHDLNRTDKHINVTPINLRTSANKVTYLVIESGLVLVVGSRVGQHMYAPRKSPEEIARMSKPTGVYKVPRGQCLSFGTAGCTPEESFDFLVTTPGAKFKTDMKPTFDVALQDVEGFELEPVIAVLNQMRQLTESILLTFLGRFG